MIKQLREGVLHYYLEDQKGNEIDFDFEFDDQKAMDFLIDRYGLKELIKFMIHEYYYKHPIPKDTIDALKEEYPKFNSLQDLEFIVDGDHDVDPDLEFIWGTFSDDIDYVLDSHAFDDDLESYFLEDAEEEFNDIMEQRRDTYSYYGMSQDDFVESKKLKEGNDLFGRPSHKKDDNFYTLNRSIPDLEVEVNGSVRVGLVNTVDKILDNLQIDDVVSSSDILFTPEVKNIVNELKDFLINRIRSEVENKSNKTESLKESVYYDVMRYDSGNQEYMCTFEAENEDDAYDKFLDWMNKNYLDADSGYYIDTCYQDNLMDRKVVDLSDFDVAFDEEDEDFEA